MSQVIVLLVSKPLFIVNSVTYSQLTILSEDLSYNKY